MAQRTIGEDWYLGDDLVPRKRTTSKARWVIVWLAVAVGLAAALDASDKSLPNSHATVVAKPPIGLARAAAEAVSPPMRRADIYRGPRSTTTFPTPQRSVATVPTRPAGPARVDSGYGCSAALAWLTSHAAPGFRFECPGNALGHQAMTCDDARGVCPGQKIIVIADPCPAAYMNEAHNSWIVAGLTRGRLDPYGYCH